ncbi:MAG: hydroxylamine reductase [Candidatus Omnitrophica bacterium]|nr:hydroxylamine reductase [Candidatus Omnitrophota bacterium]
MFCRQCEQTAQGKGCTVKGVCGKTDETAALQDTLLYALKGIGVYGVLAQKLGIKDALAERFIMEGLFTTITNVNFYPEKIEELIRNAFEIKERLKKKVAQQYLKQNKKELDTKELPACANWVLPATKAELIEQAKNIGVLSNPGLNEDIRSLRELLLYGLKGMAAYADHALILGKEDRQVNEFFYKALAAQADAELTADDLTALVMEFGKVNLKCLEILDKAHTEKFGNPIPTKVGTGIKPGPAIIVSGHDLLDLYQLLGKTQGQGVNIYTHGEMLPAHGYPELKKFKHLVGHFGTAWQNQQKEFDNLPAAVLMTTNCIQKPKDSYLDRIFTTGLVAWPGVFHIQTEKDGNKDFGKIIAKAKELNGFKAEKKDKEIQVGFAHKTVLQVADKVIDAVKAKKIRHFFLIGGCDGAKPGRNYYTDFAQKVPQDCVILTLACGKFRFNRLDFGDIAGIPRLLDCGQCNDAYSAIIIASALAKAFNCGVNDLPLSLVLSWYEQKAVCILITLLSLGIKNIKIGPTLPAFISANVLKILVEKFNIQPITDAEKDIKEILKN